MRSRIESVVTVTLCALSADLARAVSLDVAGGNTGGKTRLITFFYTTQDGSASEATLFVKRCAWKRRSEAVHYRHLTTHGVPTPRLYGALRDDSGEEIIFLEPLTATGFQSNSEEEWRRMLSLLARFNACPITPDYAPYLHRFEQVGRMDGGTWILGLNATPSNEELEAGLRAGDIPRNEMPELLHAAQTLYAQVAAQPQGLLHQDFLSNNLGWRGEREELVVFDLHKNALGPRFADAAPYLGLPDWSDSAVFLDDGENGAVSRRERLTQHYLDEYARFGGPAVSLQNFRDEASALSWSHKIAALPWLPEQGQQARIHAILDFLRQRSRDGGRS